MKKIDLKPEKPPVWYSPTNPEGGVNHFHLRMSHRSRVWSPPTDVYASDDLVIVLVEVAGMKNAEFAISLDGSILTVQGFRPDRPDRPERRAYHQMEIRFGEFISQVELHWAVEQDGIDAKYEDGFLRIILPMAKPHQVEIGE